MYIYNSRTVTVTELTFGVQGSRRASRTHKTFCSDPFVCTSVPQFINQSMQTIFCLHDIFRKGWARNFEFGIKVTFWKLDTRNCWFVYVSLSVYSKTNSSDGFELSDVFFSFLLIEGCPVFSTYSLSCDDEIQELFVFIDKNVHNEISRKNQFYQRVFSVYINSKVSICQSIIQIPFLSPNQQFNTLKQA